MFKSRPQNKNDFKEEDNSFFHVVLKNDDKEYIPLALRRKKEKGKAEKYLSSEKISDNKALVIRKNESYKKISLLNQKVKLNKFKVKETRAEQVANEELNIFKQVTSRKALMATRELALGLKYTDSLDSGWRPPLHIRKMSTQRANALRDKFQINVEGYNIPPPIEKFRHLRLPIPILKKLKKMGSKTPFKIQIQGLPIGLSGRDMIGISYTGSGKTLAFIIPVIMVAYQEEIRFPLLQGEGPIGLILCPSRELSRQTYGQVQHFCQGFKIKRKFDLNCILCIGGIKSRELTDLIRHWGIHIMIATLGKLKDFLYNNKITFDHCRIVCLDEADRMVDLGFEDDIRDVWSFFKSQRQTLMFSATMPAKILQFAESALVNPITVKVSRAGAANANIIQQVEYVKCEHRLPFIIDCLSRTAPPVLIFTENKTDVDNVQEYLLVKGVDTVAVHGGKGQDERDLAIKKFKSRKADVLVATDVASKGLDFFDIKHVINFDMPKDIENYVHRIGRTGRGPSKGLATTFINKECSESILRDLKGILKEASQRIPPILYALDDPTEIVASEAAALTGHDGCIYCGGLGHRVGDCHKLKSDKKCELRHSRANSYVGAGANF
jgi:ATP-dependent RNA helicase DDX41